MREWLVSEPEFPPLPTPTVILLVEENPKREMKLKLKLNIKWFIAFKLIAIPYFLT